MKYLSLFSCILVFSAAVTGQSDVQKIVDAEHAFAQMAAEKGTKAFLANMTEDAIVFVPDKASGKTFWTPRPVATSLLS